MDATDPASPHLALVVEDDPRARRALVLLLRHFGWRAIAAGSVAEAMGSLSARPVCMILDLMLPDGNGVGVLRHVRTHKLPIRVVVATGVHDPAMLAAVSELRPDALYRKPINGTELAAWLAESLELSAQTGSGRQ